MYLNMQYMYCYMQFKIETEFFKNQSKLKRHIDKITLRKYLQNKIGLNVIMEIFVEHIDCSTK